MPIARIFTWGTTALLAAVTVGAQAPQAPRFGEVVEVTVVNLPVWVSDRKGNPVTDLKRRDFEVFEDGKRVRITNFDLIRRTPPDPAAPAVEPAAPSAESDMPPPEESERLFLAVYLDEVHIRPHNRNRLFDQIDEFLAARERYDDRVMIVRYDRGLSVEQPLTGEAGVVAAALQRVESRVTSGNQPELERRRVVREIREIMIAAAERPFSDPCDDKDRMLASVDRYAGGVQAEVEGSLRALGEFATSLGGLPGRKVILYVNDGMPLRAGEDLQRMVTDACPPRAGDLQPGTAAALQPRAAATANLLDDLGRQANRNGVTLHTLQSSGLEAPASSEASLGTLPTVQGADGPTPSFRFMNFVSSPGLDLIRRINRQDTLTAMADATGGRAILDTNDFRGALGELESDLNTYYSLGYQPKRKGDRKDHRIEVRVKRKGVRVRHPASHRDNSRLDQVANRTLAALWYNLDYNPMGAAVLAGTPTTDDDGNRILPVLLNLPIQNLQLVPHEGRYVGQVSVFVGRAEAGGRKPPARRSVVPIRVTGEEYLNALEHPYQYGLKLVLRPGTRRLAFGILDELGGGYSILYRKLEPGLAD